VSEAATLEWQPCPCGHSHCERLQPRTMGVFYVGTGFEPDEAAELSRRWDSFPKLLAALTKLVELDSDGEAGCVVDPLEYGEALNTARALIAGALDRQEARLAEGMGS
jgi:hypothetical protein